MTKGGFRLADDTTTECLLFPDIFSKPVVAQFDQRQGSSDGGAILLKAADRRLGLTEALAACLVDQRQPGKVEHEMEELLAQRVYGIACGYADANDAARVWRADPVHKLLVGRDPVEGADLASQPTLSRFENAPDRKQLYRLAEALADACRGAPSPPAARPGPAHYPRSGPHRRSHPRRSAIDLLQWPLRHLVLFAGDGICELQRREGAIPVHGGAAARQCRGERGGYRHPLAHPAEAVAGLSPSAPCECGWTADSPTRCC